MTFVTDEKLMAYSDGELSAEECRELETMLAEDAELRRRLGPFAMTGAPLADVFGQPMREPVPERLLALIRNKAMNGKAHTMASSPAQGLGARMLDAIGQALFPNGLQMGSALAAAALVVTVGAAGWMLAGSGSGSERFMTSRDGVLVASGALALALEQHPRDAVPVADGSGARIIPVQSFRDRAQRFCREYEMSSGDGRRSAGLACRTGQSEWHVAYHGDIIETADSYAPAEGVESPALKAARAVLMAKGSILSTEDEHALIARNWATAAR